MKFVLLLTVLSISLRADINVWEAPYNADPTGVVDSTAAIQAAINEAEVQTVRIQTGTFNDRTGPAVNLGSGTYKTTAPLTYYQFFKLTASGARIIPAFTGFVLDYATGKPAHWMEISNLTIVGGSGIRLYSATDNGSIRLNGMKFIECATALDVNTQNAQVTIIGCLFHRNSTAIINRACDYLMVKESRFNSGARTANQQADITNKGRMILRDVLMVPMNNLNGYSESAWINNYFDSAVFGNGGRSGSLWIDGGYIGGEPGAFSAVNNFAQASPNYYTHTMVAITNSSVWSYDGVIGTSCGIVRLFKVPNDLRLTDCTGFKDTLALCWGGGVNGATEVTGIHNLARVKLDNIAQWHVLGYGNPSNYLLPELLLLDSAIGNGYDMP